MLPARLIVILGPTAGGKSELACHLAQRLGGEILGADSMQVYRHLDAGTAKPSPALRALVPHHLIDIVEPTERFTVADWLARAQPLITDLLARGRCPIVVGGTNLYLKALLEGLFEGPAIDWALRHELAQQTPQILHQRLTLIDPEAARRIHPNDQRKLIRALEVFHLTGKPISAHQQQWYPAEPADEEPAPAGSGPPTPPGPPGSPGGPRYRFDPILLGLAWPTEVLNQRINRRVKHMFAPEPPPPEMPPAVPPETPEAPPGPSEAPDISPARSLPQEVIELEGQGLLGPQAREALGYKQVLEHLAGRYTLEVACEQTKILTRRYAKTQRTWLRRYQGVHWLAAAELPERALFAAALAIVENSGGSSVAI